MKFLLERYGDVAIIAAAVIAGLIILAGVVTFASDGTDSAMADINVETAIDVGD